MKIQEINSIKATIKSLTEIKKLVNFFKNLNENISTITFSISDKDVFKNIFKNEESKTFKKNIFKQEIKYRYKKIDIVIKLNSQNFVSVDGQKIQLFLPLFGDIFLDFFLIQKHDGKVVKYYF